jgi:hypothetical protein
VQPLGIRPAQSDDIAVAGTDEEPVVGLTPRAQRTDPAWLQEQSLPASPPAERVHQRRARA